MTDPKICWITGTPAIRVRGDRYHDRAYVHCGQSIPINNQSKPGRPAGFQNQGTLPHLNGCKDANNGNS